MSGLQSDCSAPKTLDRGPINHPRQGTKSQFSASTSLAQNIYGRPLGSSVLLQIDCFQKHGLKLHPIILGQGALITFQMTRIPSVSTFKSSSRLSVSR